MGSIKLYFGIFVIVVAVYLCVELIPPYYTNYQLQDAVRSEALYSTNNNQTEDDIRNSVFRTAQRLEIPVTLENIKVHREGINGSGSVSISVPYDVHVSLPGYPLDLHFDVSSTNRGAN
jgi:predicted membrane protein